MKQIKKYIAGITGLSVYAVTAAHLTLDAYASAADRIKGGADQTGAQGQTFEGGVQIVTNILLFTVGLISVIAIIIGGIKYVTSNGDASAVTSAKNTVMYAVIGLVVAIMAYAIVRWVVNAFM